MRDAPTSSGRVGVRDPCTRPSFDRDGGRSYDPDTMPRLPGVPGLRAARDVQEASTTTSHRDVATQSTGPDDSTATRTRVGRQASLLPRPRRERVTERRAVLAGIALVAGIVGAVAISRSISDVIEARGQVAAARSLNDGIRAQVEAGQREIAFARGDAYLRFAARGLGYGRGREEPFALRADAPPPPSITPLGADQGPSAPDALSDFLDLLLQP